MTDAATSGARPREEGREATIPRESELKYQVPDPSALRDWLADALPTALGPVEIGDERVSLVEDRYIDTPHGALERAGFGARLRRVDGGPVTLTVKTLARDRGGRQRVRTPRGTRALSQRVEVEAPASDRLDPADWPPSPAQELVDELRGAGRLRALFVVRQRRRLRRLRFAEGSAEMTLDDVLVLRGGRTVGAFAAMEVEATGGRDGEALLTRLAPVLESSGLVVPETRSKEAMARELVAEELAHRVRRLPRVPRSPGVRADDPLATAGRKVLRMHLARMLAAEAGTRAGEDVEDLHRMRVATRRMRAAWRVFEGAYRPRLERRYVRELRDVATALGVVRDLDVLLEDLAAHAAGQPDAGREALQPLRADWQAQRETARDRLIALLDSKQYRDFVEDYLDFVETPGAGERGPVAGRPVLVRDTAGSRILAAYEHVRAYQTTIAWADLPTLHALRIEGKRLRYTLEYFAEVLPPPAEQLIAEVTAMQDHLGLLNDAHVAAGLIRAWLQTNAARIPSASVQAVGTYLESREATMRRLRRTFGPVWRRVIGRSFRRRLGLAIAAIE